MCVAGFYIHFLSIYPTGFSRDVVVGCAIDNLWFTRNGGNFIAFNYIRLYEPIHLNGQNLSREWDL